MSDYYRYNAGVDDGDSEVEGEVGEARGASWFKRLAWWRKGDIIPFSGARRGGVHLIIMTELKQAQEAADLIKSGVAVVANLQLIDKKVAQRIVDVLSGVCYALDGTFMRFGDRLFLFAPPTVPASGDEKCMKEINQLFIGGIANGIEQTQLRSGVQSRLMDEGRSQ